MVGYGVGCPPSSSPSFSRAPVSTVRTALVLGAMLGFLLIVALIEGAAFGGSGDVGGVGGRPGRVVVATDDDEGASLQSSGRHALSSLDDGSGSSGLRGTLPRNDAFSEMRPVVIAGPSGVGKGTLISMVLDHYADEEAGGGSADGSNEFFSFSVSHTTRGPRPGEVDGVHYHFSTREKVQTDIDAGKFVEHAEVHGNLYGTSFDGVSSVARAGKICVLDIDMQGVRSVKAADRIDPYYIFVAPPSMEELETRLRARGTETEEALQIRTANAAREVEYGTAPGNFDAVVVNADKELAFRHLLAHLRMWYPHLED